MTNGKMRRGMEIEVRVCVWGGVLATLLDVPRSKDAELNCTAPTCRSIYVFRDKRRSLAQALIDNQRDMQELIISR